MKIWLAGEKIDDLLRKNVNIRGKRWKNRENGKIFTVLREKISFLKKKGGGEISYIGQIYTPVFK